MTRLVRERLSVGRGDVVPGLLVALLASTWFVVSRPGPDAADSTASTGSGLQSALIADATRTPTTAPNPNPSPTPSPGSSSRPSAVPSPSTGRTPRPSQSRPPAPSNAAAPTPTPEAKSPPTPGTLPDLRAAAYWVVDARVVCGRDNTSYVKVQNSGEAAAPAGVAVLFLLLEDGKPTWTEIQTIPVALPPGGSYTVKAVFRLAEPCPVELARTWSFSIDPANAIKESKEDNNSAAIDWKTACG